MGVLARFIACCAIMAISSCGAIGSDAKISYRPLGGPVEFEIASNGEIAVSLGAEFLTPIGTIEVGQDVNVDVTEDQTLLTITSIAGREAWAIEARSSMTVCLDGQVKQVVDTSSEPRIDITVVSVPGRAWLRPGATSCDFSNTGNPVPPDIDVAGVWTGTYECGQGITGAKLTISGSANESRAVFKFYAIDANPGVPDGEFTLSGDLSEGQLKLFRDSWITQPPDYDMVDVLATSVSPSRMTGGVGELDPTTGEIAPGSCGALELTRG